MEAETILALGKAEAEVKVELGKANERLLSDNYVRIKYAEAFKDSQHLKIIFMGDKIPESIIPLIDFNTVKNMLQKTEYDETDSY